MIAQARLFHWLAMAWLFCYAGTVLFLGDAAWAAAMVPLGRSGSVWAGADSIIEAIGPGVGETLLVLLMATALLNAASPKWYLGLGIWLVFRLVSHRLWLASNGGVQLMENMLLWNALMAPGTHADLSRCAFRLARAQLLLTYAAAAAHKFTGTAWNDGTAVLRVAQDDLFRLGWLVDMPLLCGFLTYAVLVWTALFSLAMLQSRVKHLFLAVGVLFHLSTALLMGIPQMGFAFVACYALWMGKDEARAVLLRIARVRTRKIMSITTERKQHGNA